MMAFVARRLLAERVVMVFGVRRSPTGDAFTGLDEMTVTKAVHIEAPPTGW